jgi:2-polyprenyl-6-methoxyphenol hydroxylase-like FAD-dependent oxidoreductase
MSSSSRTTCGSTSSVSTISRASSSARQAPSWLIDSYQDERHRVDAQVLALTDGFNRLILGRSIT